MKVGYLVLHYQFSDITNTCINAIFQHDPGAYVLIVDNGSSDPYVNRDLDVLRLEENYSLAAAMNKGTIELFRRSNAEAVFQLNNDIVITGSTPAEFQWGFDAYPQIGIASCLMSQEDADFAFFACPYGPGELAETYLKTNLPSHVRLILPFVDNAAFVIRRRTWDMVGPLEEHFSGASWGANYDYCWRARNLGWEVGLIKSTFVFHLHRATWKQLDPNYFENSVNRMMIEAKEVWGDQARQVLWRDQNWRRSFLDDISLGK